MLSRVANSLYWMSRYIERADEPLHRARRLRVDVNLQLLLDFRNLDDRMRSPRTGFPSSRARATRSCSASCTPRHRPDRDAVPRLPAGEPQLHRLLHRPGPRERPHGARPDHRRGLGGDQPPLPLPALAPRPRAALAREPVGFFPGDQERLAAPAGPDRRHRRAQRGLVLHPGRPLPRARRQDLAHPRRAPRLPPGARRAGRPPARPTPSAGPPCSAPAARGTPTRPSTAPRCSPALVAEFLLLSDDFPRSVRSACATSTPLRRISGVPRAASATTPKNSPAACSPSCSSAPPTTSSTAACTPTSTCSRPSSTPSATPSSKPTSSSPSTPAIRRRAPPAGGTAAAGGPRGPIPAARMKLQILHRTHFAYAAPVRDSFNEARLQPVTTDGRPATASCSRSCPPPG
jgi:hypothetical protein